VTVPVPGGQGRRPTAAWLSPPIAALERAAAAHWQAADQEWLGRTWLLRGDGGFTGRANSALPLGPPGMPLVSAVAEVEAWYAARGLPAMVVIPGALRPGAPAGPAGPSARAGPAAHPSASLHSLSAPGCAAGPASQAAGMAEGVAELDGLLAAKGWRIRAAPAVVMTAAAAEVAASSVPDVPVALAERPDDGWLARYRYRGQELPAGALRLLLSAPWQAFASVVIGGRTAAVGRVSVAAGWGGLTVIDVAPEHRRSGLGTAVTAALAAAAISRGASRIFLQVEEGNTAALALYARCGFRAEHRYRYRIAG
jgi:ribosomal protein S18 acetylase RimI-like enzyme